MGRDLHDDIIQSIYAVGLNLEDCRRVVRHSPDEADAKLTGAIHTLNSAIRSVRGFIAGLEPKVLNGRELKAALKSLALTSDIGTTHIQIEVDSAAAGRLTSVQATHLLQIAKETISNSLRHARASLIKVSVQQVIEGVRLEVQDDGIGFDAGAASGGQGLRNLSARVREMGAELRICSSPGKGCSILVTIPGGN